MTAQEVEEIRKHVRVYIVVFAALAALTVITVAVSYLHLPTSTAIAVALLIATVKGSLVALYFMHLISERKTIYLLLSVTVVFLSFVLYMPAKWNRTEIKVPSVWSSVPVAPAHGHGKEADH